MGKKRTQAPSKSREKSREHVLPSSPILRKREPARSAGRTSSNSNRGTSSTIVPSIAQIGLQQSFFQRYEERMDEIHNSIRELQTSVEFLKKEQQKKESVPKADVVQNVPLQELQGAATASNTSIKSDNNLSVGSETASETPGYEKNSSDKLANLNQELDEVQKKINTMQSYYISQNQSLERELRARQQAIHERVEDERAKAESEVIALLKHRDTIHSEIRALNEERDTLRKEISLAKSFSNLLRNPEAISASDLGILTEKFIQAKAVRAKAPKSLSDTYVKEARRSLLATIEKVRKAS